MNLANCKKTIYYLKRNGIKNTFYAVAERLSQKALSPYEFEPVSLAEHERQRKCFAGGKYTVKFSIVVPLYCTPVEFLREMIQSVLNQTYGNFELLLLDATPGEGLKTEVEAFVDDRIRYVRLEKNAGISENTNPGFLMATGDYVGLLDHDDVLTEDALFEMADHIQKFVENGKTPTLLYSDEDKADGTMSRFYEPHFKEDFNLDLLLTNNYICHFTVLRVDIARKLLLRGEYNGAQDFDLVLRVAKECFQSGKCDEIVHVNKILYHWRCHQDSTAQNPQSKLYAYEAGKRAVQDFVDALGFHANVEHMKHLGFYKMVYQEPVFQCRRDIGAVGGPIYNKNHLVGGRMDQNGTVYYENLPIHYSGYMNRGVLDQDAQALDFRNFTLNPACKEIFLQTVGVPYTETQEGIFDCKTLPQDMDLRELEIQLGRKLTEAGYRLLYRPAMGRKAR